VNGYNGHYEEVDPRTIIIDHTYQRPKKNTLVQRIAQSPSWEAFGVPVCFRRANGMLYCADGQQRIAGMLASEKPPKLIPVVWFDIQDVSDEADVFVRINEWRKSLQPIEKHRGKIISRDPAALAMERAVAQAGFTIDNATGSGTADARTITAIAALGVVYNRIGEEGVLQTLTCIREAWGDDFGSTSAQMLRGVATLIEEQGENYVRAKLITALKKSTPSKIDRKADELRLQFGGSKQTQVRTAFSILCGLKMPKEETPKRRAAA